MEEKRGLMCFIYKRDGELDATNKGLSSKTNFAILIGNGIIGPFEPNEFRPALYLHRMYRVQITKKKGNILSETSQEYYLYCSPEKEVTPMKFQFGGNFLYSTDSRFPNRYPIPIHDREE